MSAPVSNCLNYSYIEKKVKYRLTMHRGQTDFYCFLIYFSIALLIYNSGQNLWTNGTICEKVAFPMYTESLKFSSQSLKPV